MARKGSDHEGVAELEGSGGSSMQLTPEHRKAIMVLVYHEERLALDKEALAEDVKGVAGELGVKPAEVKKMVSTIVQERAKGGVIESRERELEFARQILDSDDVLGDLSSLLPSEDD